MIDLKQMALDAAPTSMRRYVHDDDEVTKLVVEHRTVAIHFKRYTVNGPVDLCLSVVRLRNDQERFILTSGNGIMSVADGETDAG